VSARDDKLVYSSGRGRIPEARERPRPPRGDGIVRVRRETQGRGGKTVTSIAGVGVSEDRLRELASELKRLCGTGGSVKDWVIEVQGDHRDKIVAALEQRGYTVKRAGG
jgi:translation initiation factor 1